VIRQFALSQSSITLSKKISRCQFGFFEQEETGAREKADRFCQSSTLFSPLPPVPH
jgi:hypothetical protein